ncbi:NETI motif-containing protein [Halalkalibacterium halodurans]|uniref:NETI motif-containing protein n=1 Tax=Halalkalibacterium halodurans TaxID=86665 RepID=UPI00106883DE|nr:NETI motif-containing protein [Halalkalibacterium halodurans]TES52153.1 NETI motif-containing protein [Halalkalibacterium halodurans]
MTKKKKQRFEVGEHETIAECLARMEKAGYVPIRRMEKPVFEEKSIGGNKEYAPVRQQIVFEGQLK